jgi:hypothetical protein
MSAAFGGAIGAILVALIAATASRLEANDKRNRLLKDVQILYKLDKSAAEYGALKASIESDVSSMLRADKIRAGGAPVRTNLLYALAFMTGVPPAVRGTR